MFEKKGEEGKVQRTEFSDKNKGETLNKYLGKKNYFITFVSVENKVGVNPQSKYKTPLGIYCYPLEYSADNYSKRFNGLLDFPFPTILKNAQIFKINVPDENILSTVNYPEHKFKQDIEKLKKQFSQIDIDFKVSNVLKQYSPNRAFFVLYTAIRDIVDNSDKANKALYFSLILRDIFGYHAVIDDGSGIIHEAESCQAFIITRSIIEQVDSIVDYDGLSRPISDRENVRDIHKNEIINFKNRIKNAPIMLLYKKFKEVVESNLHDPVKNVYLFAILEEVLEHNPTNHVLALFEAGDSFLEYFKKRHDKNSEAAKKYIAIHDKFGI